MPLVAPAPGQLLRSPFIRITPVDRGGGACLELISGQRDALTDAEILLLESCRTGRDNSSLSGAERPLASGLVGRWILLDTAAWGTIRRLSFQLVDLEIAAACNAKCVFCPRDQLRRGRGVGVMERDVFYEIARKLTGHVSTFGLVGIGEPTLNKNLTEYVRHLKRGGAEVLMITNGSLLTEDLIDDILDAGLDKCLVSFTGANKRVYEENMVGLDFEYVRKNVLTLARKTRGRIPIALVAVATTDNQHELDDFSEYWKRLDVPAKVELCHSRGGTVTQLALARPNAPAAASRCGYVSARSFVSWDGYVLSCCHDISGQARLGNLLDDDLDIIIDRKLEVIANQAWFDICTRCDEKERLQTYERN